MSNWYQLIDGEPVRIDPETHIGSYMQSDDIRRVGYTTFPNGAYVSTVFLGLDHRFGEGPPILWETMIFWCDHELDNDTDRYTSRTDAEAGHERAVIKVRQAIQELDGAC